MIKFDGVSKSFDVPILNAVDLHLPRGSSLGLMGAGGVGKSVFLKLCCGLLHPSQGEVWIDGVHVGTADQTMMAALRSGVGMAFQNSALFDFMTVGENIAFPLRQSGDTDDAAIQARVAEVLEQVSLPGIEDMAPGALSGGMKKRVCLARAVIHRPRLMLCDDPTAGLDPVTSSRIFRLIHHLQVRNQATVVIASHDTSGLLETCEYVALLEDGCLVFFGPSRDAQENQHVRRFIGGDSP